MKKKKIIITIALVLLLGSMLGIMARNKEQPIVDTPLSKVESEEVVEVVEIQAPEAPQEAEASATQALKEVEKELDDTVVLAYIQSLETDNNNVLFITYRNYKEMFNEGNYRHLLSGMDEYFNNNSAIVTSSPHERKLELDRLNRL